MNTDICQDRTHRILTVPDTVQGTTVPAPFRGYGRTVTGHGPKRNRVGYGHALAGGTR